MPALARATTRWKLRRAIRVVNEIFGSLHLEKHPDKTFIGRIERGFDFLGYSFSRGPLQVARRTLQNHASQLHRLYERRKTTPAWAVWSGCLRGPLDALVPVRVGWFTEPGRDFAGDATRANPSPADRHLASTVTVGGSGTAGVVIVHEPGSTLFSAWLLPNIPRSDSPGSPVN